MSEGIQKKYKSSFNLLTQGFFNKPITNNTSNKLPVVIKNLTDLIKKNNKTT